MVRFNMWVRDRVCVCVCVCVYVCTYVRMLYAWWRRRNIYVSYMTVEFLDPLSLCGEEKPAPPGNRIPIPCAQNPTPSSHRQCAIQFLHVVSY